MKQFSWTKFFFNQGRNPASQESLITWSYVNLKEIVKKIAGEPAPLKIEKKPSKLPFKYSVTLVKINYEKIPTLNSVYKMSKKKFIANKKFWNKCSKIIKYAKDVFFHKITSNQNGTKTFWDPFNCFIFFTNKGIINKEDITIEDL